MKLIHSNGRRLEVRDVSPVIYRVKAKKVPIRINGYHIFTDDEARRLLEELRASGLFSSESLVK